MADENLAAAGRVAGTLGLNGPLIATLSTCGRPLGSLGSKVLRSIGSHQILRRPVAALHEGDGDRLRTRVHVNARFQIVLGLRHAELGGGGGIESFLGFLRLVGCRSCGRRFAAFSD